MKKKKPLTHDEIRDLLWPGGKGKPTYYYHPLVRFNEENGEHEQSTEPTEPGEPTETAEGQIDNRGLLQLPLPNMEK